MIQSISEVIRRLLSVEGLGQRVAFDHFTSPQKLPFAVYAFDRDSGGADGYHNLLDTTVTVSLYQSSRDFALEKAIFQVFIDVETSTVSSYIDAEKMYLTEFQFSFFEKI